MLAKHEVVRHHKIKVVISHKRLKAGSEGKLYFPSFSLRDIPQFLDPSFSSRAHHSLTTPSLSAVPPLLPNLSSPSDWMHHGGCCPSLPLPVRLHLPHAGGAHYRTPACYVYQESIPGEATSMWASRWVRESQWQCNPLTLCDLMAGHYGWSLRTVIAFSRSIILILRS